jgi:prolyl-tRNA synthetase
MRLSQLITRTAKDHSAEDISRNARFLVRAGFVSRLMAGVYSFLPLGLRTLTRIEDIVREEMDRVGGQEVLLPALQPRDIWDRTGRWETVDVLFKLKGAGDRDLCLGPTHEEVVTPLIGQFLRSYRNLPTAVYQIQTKFRNEPRAKSGLLRGREFRMKDMYSFHADESDLDAFYDRVTRSYMRVYERCGLGASTVLTYASGGMFSKYSHEFQTVTPYGEDVLYRVPGKDIAVNKEIVGDPTALAEVVPGYQAGSEARWEELKAIEVGNIFKLGTRFTEAFGVRYADREGKVRPVVMGCYGLGPSRVMGTIAECLSDDRGLAWPDEVAPYRVHLASLVQRPTDIEWCTALYDDLQGRGIDVLYDDREDIQPGEKLADADLIGLPHRFVVSRRTLAAGAIEWKKRTAADSTMLPREDAINLVASP